VRALKEKLRQPRCGARVRTMPTEASVRHACNLPNGGSTTADCKDDARKQREREGGGGGHAPVEEGALVGKVQLRLQGRGSSERLRGHLSESALSSFADGTLTHRRSQGKKAKSARAGAHWPNTGTQREPPSDSREGGEALSSVHSTRPPPPQASSFTICSAMAVCLSE